MRNHGSIGTVQRSLLWWSLLALLLAIAPLSTQAQTSTVDLDSYPDCGFSQQLNGVQVGAVVINLQTGTGCVEQLDTAFHVASVPKVLVAGAYYRMLSEGSVSAATTLPFTERYLMGGRNACLTSSDVGESFTNANLVERMINCSDNASTWMLMDSLGRYSIQRYVEDLDIDGFGEILPYSEVDQRKLSYIDERWNEVPAGLAARFYRRGWTAGLSQYFDEIPERPSRDALLAANRRYFAENTSNTATPRAVAEYLLLLREHLQQGGDRAIEANFLFQTMLFTQRQYSTQAFPGTVYAGSKNGFDRGVLAEVNTLYSDLDGRVPTGLAIVFLNVDTLTESNSDLPGPFRSEMNDTMRSLSPQLVDWLYPGYTPPPVRVAGELGAVTFQTQSVIQECWTPYFRSNFDDDLVPALSQCFQSLFPRQSFGLNENMGMGVILRELQGMDTRMTFIFTAPDGRAFSYQEDRRYQNQAGIYWYHPPDMTGEWQVDIYMNLRHIYSDSVRVQ